MFTKKFLLDTLERSIFTFAEAMLAFMAVDYGAIDWKGALLKSGVAFLVTVFKCVIVQATKDGVARQNERI